MRVISTTKVLCSAVLFISGSVERNPIIEELQAVLLYHKKGKGFLCGGRPKTNDDGNDIKRVELKIEGSAIELFAGKDSEIYGKHGKLRNPIFELMKSEIRNYPDEATRILQAVDVESKREGSRLYGESKEYTDNIKRVMLGNNQWLASGEETYRADRLQTYACWVYDFLRMVNMGKLRHEGLQKAIPWVVAIVKQLGLDSDLDDAQNQLTILNRIRLYIFNDMLSEDANDYFTERKKEIEDRISIEKQRMME